MEIARLPLSVRIEAPSVAGGDSDVVMQLTIDNDSDDTVAFVSRSDEYAARIVIEDDARRLVWDNYYMRVRTEPNSLTTLPGGGSRTFTAKWNLRSNSGVRVAPGFYRAWGEVADASTPYSGRDGGRPLVLRANSIRFEVRD